MDGHRLVSRRTMLAAAAAGAIPASGFAWHLLSSGAQLQSSAADESNADAVRPTDTWNPIIRVNLTPNEIQELTISVDSPFRIVVPGNPRVLAQSEPVREVFASAVSNGIGIRFGDSVLPVSQVEIVAIRPVSIRVGRSLYRGSVRLHRRPSGKLIAVNVLPLEEYLASVVNSEMPASFPDAAREAQTIAARTYALSQMKGHPLFDLFCTSRSQMYRGYEWCDDEGRRLAGETPDSREIIRDTAGIVCTYQGKIFTTWYSAVCGGQTVNGRSVFTDAVPALRSVECDWCREAKLYRWTSELPVAQASAALRQHFAKDNLVFGELTSLEPAQVGSGDLPRYTIGDGTNRHEIAGTTLRRLLPSGVLRSPQFTGQIDGSVVKLSGRGDGHGVGLCQWGARGLGIAGRSALEILGYYYSGIETVRLRTPEPSG